MAVVGTHDMPTLSGFWSGRDLAVRREIGFNSSELPRAAEIAQRETERQLLLAALALAGFPAEAEPEVALAVHDFLASSPARLLMVRLEDVLGESEQQNLPGTTTEHPNWSLRFVQTVKELAADPRIRALAAHLQRLRAASASKGKRRIGAVG